MNFLFNLYSFLLVQSEEIGNLLGKDISIKDPSGYFLGIPFIDNDIYKLLYKFVLNLIVIFVVIRLIYYPITKRKDFLFTYFLISFITFFICIALKNKNLDTGMALGLFAIFGIIRYRTDAIPIKEMTYLFVVIGISVINALSGKDHSHVAILFVNITLILMIYGFEYIWLLKHESSKLVIYEKIELIKKDKEAELIQDLENRTGLKINRVTIGKIDLLKDTAQVFIYYYERDAGSNYNSKSDSDDSDD